MMNVAPNYEEYYQLGLILDKLRGKDLWKLNKQSTVYDWERIEDKIIVMRKLRGKKDIKSLVQYLR